MEHLYTTICKVLRGVQTLGTYNRPKVELVVINTYNCKLDRQNIQNIQADPQVLATGLFRLYTYPTADIKAGDVIQIDDAQYKASTPIKKRTHMEVDITFFKEV